jgi:acyl carrier protein
MMNTESEGPTKDVIVGKLREAFVKVTERDPASIDLADTAKLREDLGLDSFAALELIFELEDMLSVRIPQDAAATFQTVADVVAYVQTQLASPPGAGTP